MLMQHPHRAQANYAGVVILDSLVLLLAVILNPLARRRRMRQAALEGGDVENAHTGARHEREEQLEAEEKETRRIQDKEASDFPAGTPGRILETESHNHSHRHIRNLQAGTGLQSRETTICAEDHYEAKNDNLQYGKKEDVRDRD